MRKFLEESGMYIPYDDAACNMSVFDELPQPLKDLDYKTASYWLYLVIKESKEDWIVNLSADLHKELHPFLKCWNIPDANFLVVNEKMAMDIGIVVQTSQKSGLSSATTLSLTSSVD